MAEAVFGHLVRQAGLDDQIEVDSAGTADYHVGERAHPGTRRVLEKHGIFYDGRSRHLTRDDLRRFDYIIAMDNENLDDIRALGETEATVARLLDFAPEQPRREVPDPYYSGLFEETYPLVLAGAQGLLARIQEDRNL
jgi:protein-tyrosine phosphatase